LEGPLAEKPFCLATDAYEEGLNRGWNPIQSFHGRSAAFAPHPSAQQMPQLMLGHHLDELMGE